MCVVFRFVLLVFLFCVFVRRKWFFLLFPADKMDFVFKKISFLKARRHV